MSIPQSSPIKFALAVSVGVATLIFTYTTLLAQVAPNLGTAAQFALLGNSGVTGSSGSGTDVSGSVGSFPTGSISNFPPSEVVAGTGTLHTTANATVELAQTHARAAYAELEAQGGTPVAGDSLNATFTSGVYSLGAADLPASTTLVLNGPGIFVFNVASTLTMNESSAVIGTANPCNVYWRVGTSATLNGTSFMGTVLADASITVSSASVVTGRLLSGMGATGATTLAVGGGTVGGCSAALVVPTIAKAFNPISILPGATSQLTITINNPNPASSSLTAVFTDTLPAGVTVAATPAVSTTCGGAASATAGGTTVSLASSSVIPAGSCTIQVNVTATVPGSYVNTLPVGALQTSAGNNAVAASSTLAVTCPVITLAPATIPNGLVGTPFSQTLTAGGGTAPYTFAVISGALPTGVALTSVSSNIGLLSGTPTTNGSYEFTMRATDSLGCLVERSSVVVITTAVPTMPQMFLMLLAILLTTIGYVHLRKA